MTNWLRSFVSNRVKQVPTLVVSQENALQYLIALGEAISSGVFARLETNRFLDQILTAVVQPFSSVYHAQVFLTTPDGQKAVLRAGTPPLTGTLLAQDHALDVGGLSAVGRCTLTGQHVLIVNYAHEANYQPHLLLSETRSQLVMPLRADQVVIGVLDLHSKQPNGFSETDIILLHAVANQVAVAVDGLQLHETSQHSLHEKQVLYQQTQNNLREIERLNYQLTGRMWSEYLRLQAESTNINLDLETNQIVREVDWTSTLSEAAQQRQLVSTIQAGHRVVAAPIMVRNEVIGAMEFELESDQELPPAAVDLLRAVGQRIGMAIDNRRLLDETHRIAQREALINDISANLQSATSVNTILQRAARHLQEALAAQEVTIRLGVSGSQELPVEGRDRL